MKSIFFASLLGVIWEADAVAGGEGNQQIENNDMTATDVDNVKKGSPEEAYQWVIDNVLDSNNYWSMTDVLNFSDLYDILSKFDPDQIYELLMKDEMFTMDWAASTTFQTKKSFLCLLNKIGDFEKN